MGALGGLLANDARWTDASSAGWYSPAGGSGLPFDAALTVSALYAGISYVAEDVAKIPLNMFEDLGDKGHRPAPEHYLQEKLHDEPNEYQTALEFREMMVAFAYLRRFGIAEIRRGQRALIDDQWYPLHPDLVREDLSERDRRRYFYRDPRNSFIERELMPDQVIILRGRLGRSVMDFARQSIGVARAQEQHVANQWARGAKPGGIVLRDKAWSGTERTNFRRALEEYSTNGVRSGRALLLEDGMTWQDVGMTSVDSELLDSRRFTIVEGCRWIRIPPHKLFELERSTNNNIERQSVDYVVDSLLGWTERWEQVIRRDLIAARERARFFAEHNLDGLMRGDIKTRYDAYESALRARWLVRDEVRAKENLSPIPGGDVADQPLNLANPGGNPKTTSQVAALEGRLKLHAATAASRVVRREMAGVEKLLEKTAAAALPAALEGFYADHAKQVSEQLHISEHEALRYARDHRDAVLAGGQAAMGDWLVAGAEALTDLAIDHLDQDQQEIAA